MEMTEKSTQCFSGESGKKQPRGTKCAEMLDFGNNQMIIIKSKGINPPSSNHCLLQLPLVLVVQQLFIIRRIPNIVRCHSFWPNPPIQHWQWFVQILVSSARLELLHTMALATQQPFGGQKALNAHWPSGMNSPCADAHLQQGNLHTFSQFDAATTCLSTQPKPVAIRKSCACIVEDAGTVHLGQEVFGRFVIVCHNAFGVATAVANCVGNSLLNVVHHLRQHSTIHGRMCVPQTDLQSAFQTAILELQ